MSEIAESFASSLSDLTVNSKPHINMLTMLADDHQEFAGVITETILNHLEKVRPEVKLPVLYLIDSIVKNVGKGYISLFSQSIVPTFTNTFDKVDEKTREQMFKLRQTWNEVFPAKTMYALDTKVQKIDPAWPVTAPPSTVHLNPKFFKSPDMLDSKSLTSIKQADMPQIESRSRHRKSKSYSRSRSVTNSAHSKKVSSTTSSSSDSVPVSKLTATPPPEQLREQMIMKQKLLLELQQKKLKLELLQTQAQLEEQQKQLEKHSINHKASAELSKLQKMVSEEEAKLKTMSKNLKKQVQLKKPKLQQIHRVTSEMKAQKVTDISKVSVAPESMVKQSALLELSKEDISIKISKPLPPKSKVVQIQHPVVPDKPKVVAAPDPAEDTPLPVRIAPVSTQLINAALTFRRNIRDPRIRQMSSRMESQLNASVSQTPITSGQAPIAPPSTNPVKKPDLISETKTSNKQRKDKKPSTHQHRERYSKSSEEDSKSHSHSRSSSRNSEKSSNKFTSKSDKSPPSKRIEDKYDKTLKVDELFIFKKSKSPVQVRSHTHSPLKSHNKRDKPDISDLAESTKSSYERTSRTESSPKRTKLQDSWQESNEVKTDIFPVKEILKLNIEITKSQNSRQLDSFSNKKPSVLADSSAEMLYEDIEKIVRHPDIVTKSNKQLEIRSKPEEFMESPKSSDDSTESKFDEIIKNPSKILTFDKINKVSEENTTLLNPYISDVQNDKKLLKDEIKLGNITEKPNELSLPFNSPDKLIKNTINRNEESFEKQSDIELAENNKQFVLNASELDNDMIIPNIESLFDHEQPKQQDTIHYKPSEIVLFSTINAIPDYEKNTNIISHKDTVQIEKNIPEPELLESLSLGQDSVNVALGNKISDLITSQSEFPSGSSPKLTLPEITEHLVSLKTSEKLTLSPKKIQSPVKSVEPMEIIPETNEVTDEVVLDMECLSPKGDQRLGSPTQQDKSRKSDKPTLMEQVITDAETHDSSPSPPPPPIISDKFKGIKQSSLSRLRRVGRSREDLADSESPEPADVDLRPQILPPSLTKDLKNELLGLGEKDVDLRNLPGSPTKKRPSMEKLLDIPPAKKSKAEVMDELFGSEDVDLRPVLCPPPPSPPPPPIISSSPPPDVGGERLWARYKQAKPDTYKAKYTPSRRDRAPSVDRFGRSFRHSISEDGNSHLLSQGRSRMNFEDIDMRAQPSVAPDLDHIIRQAIKQHQRGELNDDAYKRVLSEVVGMSEKQKLEEAQRLEHADTNQTEQLDPVSEDDISGGSLSGVEDAPSPTASYSGGEDTEDPTYKKNLSEEKNITGSEPEKIQPETLGDVDIRMPPADVDIRIKIDYQPRKEIEAISGDEKLSRKSRSSSPYSRKPGDPEHDRYRSRREELKAQRREKKLRQEEDEPGTRFRKPRFNEDSWDTHSIRSQPAEKSLDMDAPRVPPLPQYDSDLKFREPPMPQFPPEPDMGSLRPPPAPWDQPRMAAPAPGPWMSGGMPPPLIRGPHGMGMRPQERFMGPRWRHGHTGPAAMFEGEQRFNRFGLPPMPRFPPLGLCEVPPTDPAVLKLIEEDPTKSINIDGMPRDIRFYGTIAVALMNWDDPREVTFQPGQRRVIMDDRDSVVVHFNAPPVDMLIDGNPHRVRFGAPTRELYIDNQWYEVFFGGAPVTCDIAGHAHTVQLEGPPPPVRPGVQRKDLVVGRVTLIIDAEMLFTVYLDAKPQKFEVKGVSYIIRFVEALQKTVINGVAFKSDFGGLPKPIILSGTKHFFRLTALPRGVTPGYLTIVNMEGGRRPSPTTLPAPPQLPASLEQAVDFKPDLKVDPFLQPPVPIITAPPLVSPELLKRDVEKTSVPPPPIPPLAIATIEPLKPPPVVNSLDLLANLMPVPEPGRAVEYNYSMENENSNHNEPSTTATAATTTTTAPALSGEINVTELLQKLMATGIVPSLDKPKDKTAVKHITADTGLIKPVDFRKPDTLKIRQTALISNLYSGIQCNSCGVRFPPEQTMKYSQHLDWHFRQNRRDKDSTRTAQTRRYYYDVNDWVQFEEIEDLEERAQPWFEMQEGGAEEEEPPQVLVSVRSADYPDEATCFICNDKFESFYNEEKEEWHLRNAVDQDGKLVHPVCLEDQRAAAEKPIIVEDIDITDDEPKEEEIKETTDKETSKTEEDDDIMEVTDIEFVKPVFPVEDLTVSDSESVADNTEEIPKVLEEEENEKVEEKPEEEASTTEVVGIDATTTEVNDLPQDPEESKEEESEVIENDSKSEDTQDDLVILDKGEDSALNTEEIMEVIRNIKKDPDILGGEYEEIGLDPNIEIKKEKGEVPMPDPVVDTTHTSVTCLIDGNVEFDETPQQMNVGGPTKIKINITKPNVQTTPKETKEELEVIEGDTQNNSVTSTLSFVSQPPPPGEEPLPQYVKPKLIGRKLQELPPVLKGSELSGLCSIM